MMKMRSTSTVDGLSVPTTVAPPSPMPSIVDPGKRRRRPSGAAPPLPRQIGRTGRGWFAVAALLSGWLIVMLTSPGARRLTDRVDAAVLRRIVTTRTSWLTTVARGIDRLASGWALAMVALGLIVATVAFRRWRHLFTFLVAVVVVEVFGMLLIDAGSRPRPYDVEIIGRWQGYSLPSATIAVVSFTAIGVLYMLVPAGRSRSIGKRVALGVIAVVALCRLYLAVDHPTDVLTAVAIAVSIPLLAFRCFTPNNVFPVKYRAGKTAHLDVTGPRGEAIRRAGGR